MNNLEKAVAKILAGDCDELDPWTKLCVATVKLGAAFAEFENAKKEYIESLVKAPSTPKHECFYDRPRRQWIIKSSLGPVSLQTSRQKKPSASERAADFAFLDAKLRAGEKT